MIYRLLGSSDLRVSVVGLGTMSWPGCHFGTSEFSSTAEDYLQIGEMVMAARDAGINLLDTAEGYGCGLAEELLGKTLEEQGCRDDMIIVTKVGPLFRTDQSRNCNLSARHVRDRCEISLRRLRTDRIDLYLAHWPDHSTPIEETVLAMEELRAEGKIRWFGVSNFPSNLLEAAMNAGPVVVNQLPYSLLDRGIEADKRPFCEKNNVGIMAYSPLGKGMLSGKYNESYMPPLEDYRHERMHFAKENLERHFAIARKLRQLAPQLGCTPAQLALAWVLAQPAVSVVLPGAKTAAQVQANAVAGDFAIPADILLELNQLPSA